MYFLRKLAEDADAIEEAAARAKYRRDLKDKALAEIDPDFVRETKRNRLLVDIGGAGALAPLIYGIAKKRPGIAAAGAGVAGLGALGHYGLSKQLGNYLNDERSRKLENLGRKYEREKAYSALAQLALDSNKGLV